MTSGLQVINSNGILQVTSAYQNYLLERKVVLTGVLYNEFPRYGYFYEFTAPTGSMIACQPVNATFVAMHSCTVNGENSVFTFMSPLGGALLGPGGPVCTFYIFSSSLPPNQTTFGLEIYDEQSRLCFSSSSSYMNPVNLWSGQNFQALTADYMTGEGGFGYYGSVLSSQYSRPSFAFVYASPVGFYSLESMRIDVNRWEMQEDIFGCFLGWRGNQFIIAREVMGGRFWISSGAGQSAYYGYEQYYLMLIDVSRL